MIIYYNWNYDEIDHCLW